MRISKQVMVSPEFLDLAYDSSTIERAFDPALDNDPDIKMFFQIQYRFKIGTSIGSYHPDWAVYLTRNGEENLYFMLEAKGRDRFMDLHTREQLIILCGKKDFEILESRMKMRVATNWCEVNASK